MGTINMKNPWEYMSTKNTNKKTSGKNNNSEEENVDGSKPDDLQILKLIKNKELKRIARNLIKFWETPVEGFEAFWIAVIEMGLIRFIFFFFVMPFVIFAAVETTARQHQIHHIQTAINDHLVSRAKAVEDYHKASPYCVSPAAGTQCANCTPYNYDTFKDSTSIVTYFPGGRLGNTLTSYLTLYWLKLDFGLDTYFEKQSIQLLEKYFENVTAHKVLEEDLCDWKKFGWQKYQGNIELLGNPEWSTGNAIQVYLSKEDFMRHEIQGGRKYYKKFRKESRDALQLKEPFRRHAELTLQQISKKVDIKSSELTYIGIHNRRTDYLEFRRRRLGLENLYEDYFEDAIAYFKEEYGDPSMNNKNVVFVYVSDDMKWGRRKLKKLDENIFFVGCGDGDKTDCIGKDFAVLSKCNHTILTHGTFGHWASYFAGNDQYQGEMFTEYGAIVPDSHI